MRNEQVDQHLVNKVVSEEWGGAEAQAASLANDYVSYLGLIDSERDQKEYDWMSNIRIPEFASQMLTQSSIDVDQYFKTRDFVEVYVEDASDEAQAAAAASKRLLNKTLNLRSVSYYPKYIRAKLINHLIGSVYALCWWDQVIRSETIGDVSVEVVEQDHFNFDVLDPRNVRVSPEYVYSVQDKKWIIVETEKTLSELRDSADDFEYFNIDKLEDAVVKKNSDSIQSKNDDTGKPRQTFMPVDDTYKILTRYGKFWTVVEERDKKTLLPTKGRCGLDENGNKVDSAEMVEVIMTFAVPADASSGGVLIGYRPTPFVSVTGSAYRPIIRGSCYIHPSDDNGFGDGKYGRDLQTAIDDTYNLGNDRTRLATMPTFKGTRAALMDNETVFFEPEHVIELDNINDLQEIVINDNVAGSLNQLQLLMNKMNQVMAMFPTTMGALPSMSSTTATAVAGAESRTDIRSNYKSMTFEYTFLCDLYWMIQQMTWQFVTEETATNLLGGTLFDFNPKYDYWYKPISQSIESEYSKQKKIQYYLQILSYITQSQHPDALNLFNYLIQKILELLGDEFANFGNKLLSNKAPLNPMDQASQAGGPAASNQYGAMQSPAEQAARGTM